MQNNSAPNTHRHLRRINFSCVHANYMLINHSRKPHVTYIADEKINS